ncbi:lysylphosphatidylglycerol synthase transmembrane domain-containing protein [Salisediminibacterium selenitireducens]|uniref:Phosphatidylglycerol lysyltransferase n=1 Tax=Bacillus selenitireducens (strain ATCC 700615 / DSM 15326 / MLS10) TaxID=439292 RepID=D6XYR0_BACIE|nr:lysylphosphatidylglycerol synthase transmembrane domain-containing protein [Salisediminibacterium selenitireducens]ADH98218.1 conserved hypothetical protein [[Bacillus] selenitireducens MLS10]
MMKPFGLIVLVLGLLIWVGTTIEYGSVYEALVLLDPTVIAVLLLLQFFTFALMARQWMNLIHVRGGQAFWSVMNILFASAFTEGITPSVKFGSEAVKGYMLRRRFSLGIKSVVETVAAQKIISISALVPFLLVTVWLWWSPREAWLTLAGVVLLVLLMVGLFSVIRRKHEVLTDWDRRRIFFHYRFSVVIWALFYTKGLLLSTAMGLDLSLTGVLLAVFVPYMAALIPVTPGGIGTFEAAMVAVLVSLGTVASTAIVFAVVFRLITFWFGAFVGAGCVFLNLSRGEGKPSSESVQTGHIGKISV